MMKRAVFLVMCCAHVGCGALTVLGDETPAEVEAPLRTHADADPSPLSAEPVLVDDVEDLDIIPENLRFAAWQRFVYNGEGIAQLRVWIPGYNGNGSLALSWRVVDPANGSIDNVGAGVITRSAAPFIDLSAFSGLVFSHRHDPELGPDLEPDLLGCRSINEVIVYVLCSEHETQFELFLPVAESWQTSVASFSDFREADWRGPTGTTLTECLEVAEGLTFAVQAPLADGECILGTLWLDRIYLR